MTTHREIKAIKDLVRAAIDRYYENDTRSLVDRDLETQRILYALYAANEVLFNYLILLAREIDNERLSRATAPDIPELSDTLEMPELVEAPLRRPMSALWRRRLERRSLGL